MANISLQTMFLALEQGLVSRCTSALFMGAKWHKSLSMVGEKIACWQPFYPDAVQLERQGYDVLDNIPEEGAYDLVLIDVPKQVDEAKFWIAQGVRMAAKDGIILLAAANEANGKRLEGWMKELDIAPENFSKNKVRVVWGTRPKERPKILDEWLEYGYIQVMQNGDGIQYFSQPGLFGWDKIDRGSALLTEYLPEDLIGVGADFGCGYGLLSKYILENFNGISALNLIDADKRALTCAKENCLDVQMGRELAFHWADLSMPVSSVPPLNFIVMNPPFHSGKLTEASLGQSFIKTAHHHLKKGGRLFMVANAHLPYEKTLGVLFSTVRLVFEKDGFKIYEGIK